MISEIYTIYWNVYYNRPVCYMAILFLYHYDPSNLTHSTTSLNNFIQLFPSTFSSAICFSYFLHLFSSTNSFIYFLHLFLLQLFPYLFPSSTSFNNFLHLLPSSISFIYFLQKYHMTGLITYSIQFPSIKEKKMSKINMTFSHKKW